MDLYVEKQCIEQMKSGNEKQFLKLFEEYFSDLYRYVARRIADRREVEKTVRLTFFDALGQIRNTPMDVSYPIWLYSLAKPRVWAQVDRASFPEKLGLISKGETAEVESLEAELLQRAERMLGKLSLEEREILKLKFFEQVADGDVMTVLGDQSGNIGPKIYRVLKRAHFLLFGESDERQGVYFGELTGFIERVRELENVEIPEVLRLTLKNEIVSRIERKDFAINAEVVEENAPKEEKKPFEVKGSNDPAKIFTEAVEEMKQEEAMKKIEEERKEERRENLIAFFEKWKTGLLVLPLAVFLIVVVFVVANLIQTDERIPREIASECEIMVNYEGEFSDSEKRSVNKGISNRICGHFEKVQALTLTRSGEGKVDVEVEISDWNLMYNFVKKVSERVPDWRIKKYERTFISDRQSGEV